MDISVYSKEIILLMFYIDFFSKCIATPYAYPFLKKDDIRIPYGCL